MCLVASIMGIPILTCPVAFNVTFGYVIIEIIKCFWDLIIFTLVYSKKKFCFCFFINHILIELAVMLFLFSFTCFEID